MFAVKLVGAKSVPLRFRPGAKTALTSLLLLSQSQTLRWFVLGVSDEQITLLTELTEEESRIWRQTKQVGSEAAVPKFSDIISDVLRRKNDRK